jgi:phage gp29-like protein
MATQNIMTALAARSLTSGQIATRVQALDYNFLGLLLPNPDPILKATGKDIKTYRELARDSHVGACIRRRKAAVKALQWGVDRGVAASRVTKAVQDMLADLDMEALIGNAVEATLYGYQPMEIDWQGGPGGPFAGVWPSAVQALPQEWFCFDAENNLRFKTRAAPLYGELLPDKKFLLPRQDATYANPYGLGDLALCYWPVVFGKGGKKFWLAFAEKYGSAFAVGKLPRGGEPQERVQLLNELEALIQNGVAVIPDDGQVELVEMAGKSASADLYERLVLHCRGEVSIVLTGTNQSVEKDAGKASAYAGLDVAEDLRDANAGVVEAAVNQLIQWTVDLNWPGQPAPVFSMWDQQAKDELEAARDKSNHEAGAQFTKSYFVRKYGYLETDLADAPVAPGAQPAGARPGATAGAAFAAPAERPDPLGAETDALDAAAAPAWTAMLDQVGALVQSAPDLATLQRELTDVYGGLDTAELVKVMGAAFALAELKGMVSSQEVARAQPGA